MKRTKFDGWLAGFCAARVCNGLVFMTYAAALPLLKREWGMSAIQAGAVASGFQLGYAISQVVFSSVADRISACTVYLKSLFVAGICSMSFALLAKDFHDRHAQAKKAGARHRIPIHIPCSYVQVPRLAFRTPRRSDLGYFRIAPSA